jgi:phospholipase C
MNRPRKKSVAAVALAATLTGQLAAPLSYAAQPQQDNRGNSESRQDKESDAETPIKHVILLIGENRTFDNVYGTYTPKHGQSVANLLSKGIVNADGSPGPHADQAKQFEIGAINPVSYFISTNKLTNPNKTAYTVLPAPEAGGASPQAVTLQRLQKDPVPAFPPFDANTFSSDQLHTLSPALDVEDVDLLTTGATGLKNCTADPTEPPAACAEPDTRVANFDQLPNTVFQITGSKLSYDSYTGDMVHRFFHMWQQSDCDLAFSSGRDSRGLPKRSLSLRRHRTRR